MLLLKPLSFSQQTEIITSLEPLVTKDVELIIIDSIAYQYRAQLSKEGKDVNQQLSAQMQALYILAAKNSLPVIITSQVYSNIDGEGVNVVGGDILKYSSKCMIELLNTMPREARIAKHRSLAAGKKIHFVIENVGIYEAKDA